MPTYNSLPAQSKHFKGKTFQKFTQDLQLAGKANRTVYGYVRAIKTRNSWGHPQSASISNWAKYLVGVPI